MVSVSVKISVRSVVVESGILCIDVGCSFVRDVISLEISLNSFWIV